MRAKRTILASDIVKTFLEGKYGPLAVKIVKAIPQKAPRSEYIIAEESKVNINKLRSVLYTFYSDKLVYYNRNRDPVKGWFIYNWMFYLDKLLVLVLKQKKEQLSHLVAEMDSLSSGDQMYVCNSCKRRLDFDRAFTEGFICPQCRTNLESFEPAKNLRIIKKEVKVLKANIAEIENLQK